MNKLVNHSHFSLRAFTKADSDPLLCTCSHRWWLAFCHASACSMRVHNPSTHTCMGARTHPHTHILSHTYLCMHACVLPWRNASPRHLRHAYLSRHPCSQAIATGCALAKRNTADVTVVGEQSTAWQRTRPGAILVAAHAREGGF